jgi:hypothetical protein
VDLSVGLLAVTSAIALAVVLALATRRPEDAPLPITCATSAKAGELVRLVGTVEASSSARLVAPIGRLRCLAFRTVAQASDGKRWRTTIDETEALPFVLRDRSGRAHVSSGHLRLSLMTSPEEARGELSPRFEAFLERHGKHTRSIWRPKLRHEEGVVSVGMQVAVIGIARWEDDHEASSSGATAPGYREAASPRRLVITPGPDGCVLVSNRPERLV